MDILGWVIFRKPHTIILAYLLLDKIWIKTCKECSRRKTMKHKTIFIGILVLAILIFSNFARKGDFPILKGPYLGQKLPGMTPEIFAPDILNSISMIHGRISFSPDGSEVFWSCNAAPVQSRWYMKQNKAGEWSRPKKSFLSIEYTENMLSYSSDSNRIFGASSGKCCYLIKNAQQAIISKQVKHNFVVRNMSNKYKPP